VVPGQAVGGLRILNWLGLIETVEVRAIDRGRLGTMVAVLVRASKSDIPVTNREERLSQQVGRRIERGFAQAPRLHRESMIRPVRGSHDSHSSFQGVLDMARCGAPPVPPASPGQSQASMFDL